MRFVKTLVFTQAALGALAVTTAAQSQEEGEASGGSGLEEVIVTAQRRAESVQKSSLTIQVLDAKTLGGVTQARDLGEVVPGLQIASGANTPQTFIRGVGAFSSDAGVQSAVGYNLDGVVVADSASVIPMFYDLQRVEVLKGPQGTLYGRNSSAGAINIITNRPNTDGTEGYVSGDIGNHERGQASGALNIPLSSVLAARGAFNIVSRDGYLSDGGDDDEQRAARLQLLFDDNENLQVLIGGDYEERDGNGPGGVYLPHLAGDGDFVGIADGDAASVIVVPIGFGPGAGFDFNNLTASSPTIVRGNSNSYVDNEQYGVFAEINYDFGPVTATFLPGYRHSRNRIGTYLAYIPFQEDLETDQQSYEFRLAHESDRVKAVAGIYYFEFDQDDVYQTAVSKARVSSFDNQLSTESSAAFGQATYSLTDSFRLTGGVRRTHEKRSLDGVNSNRNLLAGTSTTTPFAKDASLDDTSYRVSLEYDIAAASMVYATVSKGFKSGGFNAASGADYYEPETVTAYTLGARNRFLGNSLQVNVEGFYWDIEDSQQTHWGFTSTGDLGFLTVNAASARTFGGELDAIWQPTAADTVTVLLAYLHTEFGAFTYNVPNLVFLPGSIGCATTPGAGGVSVDCSGQPLPRSPTWSGTVGYRHEFDLGGHGAITASTDANFATSRWLAVDYIPSEEVDRYTRWNGSLTYDFPTRDVSVTAYVQNITDEEIPVGGVQGAFTPGTIVATVMAPRTYGLRMRVDF